MSVTADRYRAAFSSVEGQWVLNDIQRRGGVGSPLFSKDPELLARRVIRHDFALEIMELSKEKEQEHETN